MSRPESRKVLIVCAHRPGRSPSQRYRFEQYLPFLREHGFSFEFSPLLDEHDDKLFYKGGHLIAKALILWKGLRKRKKDADRLSRFDMVFIQRESHFLGNNTFEKKAGAASCKMIFDFDDSIWLADTSPGNKKWEWLKKPEKFEENIAAADLVLAGNSYLAERARRFNKNVRVIPTTIDSDIHVPMPALRNKGRVVIGWSGSISTVKHFELLVPVFKRLKEKYQDKIAFKLLGAASYRNAEVKIESVSWTEETEVQEINTFDIGVMPLPDDEWSWGKCGLKALSYMSCEVPVVLSPVGVNREIVTQNVNGFFASTDDEWFGQISRLIEDPELRTRIGRAGAETVKTEYSVQRWKQVYLEQFISVL